MSELAEGLTIDGLAVARGQRTVVHDVSLAVPRGAVVALLGANGAGKSTVVRCVAGALRATGGRVGAEGRDLTNLRCEAVRRAGVAVVPEGHRVLGQLSVEDNLRAAALHGGRAAVREAVAVGLRTFPELEQHLARPARDLSGGQQQMVALAQALVVLPRYLIVDELSLGLAPAIVRRLASVVEAIAREGTGVLLIEQFTTLALDLAVEAHVMRGGRIVLSGATSDLRGREEIVTDAYLGSSPDPAGPTPSQTARR